MMTRPNVKMTKKQLVLLVIIAAGLAVFGILTAISSAIARTQTTQYSAEYWDSDGRYSMVSVFLPEDNPITQSNVQQLEFSQKVSFLQEYESLFLRNCNWEGKDLSYIENLPDGDNLQVKM